MRHYTYQVVAISTFQTQRCNSTSVYLRANKSDRYIRARENIYFAQLEKFAREHYLMKKNDEVIYVFDDL